MWIWITLPLLENDQLIPHTPEMENEYDPTLSQPPSPIFVEEEPFQDKEPLEEEESPEEANDENLTDSSLYPDSSSSVDPIDHAEMEVHIEDDTTKESESEPLPFVEVLSSTPSPSRRSSILRTTSMKQKNTPRKSTRFPP